MPRHLLTLRELSVEELTGLLDSAQAAANGEVPDLAGAAVVTLFYEPSTRTEMSFTLAVRRAGGDVVRCDVERSSVRKGESLVDTARTIAALGVDILVVRHLAAGAPALVARSVPCAVINAGDGMHEHPTQGLVDLLTVRQIKGRIAGLRIAVVGDVAHSRVARSAAWGFTRLGASVVLAGPATLLPTAPPAPGVELTTSLEAALSGADVVMALRLQHERQAGGDIPTVAEYARLYGVSEVALRRAAPDVVVMHPGPVNLGIELSSEVAYGPRAVITRQVHNGIFVRMAALRWTLGRRSAAPRAALTAKPAALNRQVAQVVG
jgi:aspartate carbamoyltransferase catalytic subunit